MKTLFNLIVTQINRNINRLLLIVLFTVLFLLIPLVDGDSSVAAQTGRVDWSEPVLLSNPDHNAWPPAIVADPAGNVHIMWSQTMTESPPPGEGDTLYYARWNGQELSKPVDVLVSPTGAAAAPELATTPDGFLHAVWHTGGLTAKMLYSRAPACCADNPKNWSTPRLLSSPVLDKIAFVADKQGHLHVAFAAQDNWNIVYSRSVDGGETWPVLIEISGNTALSDEFTAWPRLAVDGRERIHLVWTIGPYPGRKVMYARSDDGGDRWNTAEIVDTWQREEYAQGYGPIWIDAEAVGADEIHLIWDGAPTIERTHIWSTDGGNSWSDFYNQIFPTVTSVGRSGYNDMALDSAGILHAVSIHGSRNALHATWNGGFWSPPTEIPSRGAAEHPQIAISQGNLLHFVWTNKGTEPFSVWYVQGKIEGASKLAPQELPVPRPTPTPTPLSIFEPVEEVGPTRTPRLRDPEIVNKAPSDSGFASFPAFGVIGGVVPAAILILAVAVGFSIKQISR